MATLKDILIASKFAGEGGGGITPSGTKQISITENGTTTEDVTSYSDAEITVNVSSSGGIAADDVAYRTISGSISGNTSAVLSYAFYYNILLEEASFPDCEYVDSYGFGGCYKLASISLPTCSFINEYAFVNCSSLTQADLPMVSKISSYAFASCSKLATVNVPICSHFGNSAFANCSSLVNVNAPMCSETGANTFASCRSLKAISFPNISFFGMSTFNTCVNLESLYLFTSSVPRLSGTSVFRSTPIKGYSTVLGHYGSIFVKASLYSDFISATNWAVFSSRIVSMTDAEIEALG